MANLGPGFLEPILICLVICIGAGAWLRLAKSIPLAWLQENDQIGDSILARLGLALMLVPLTAWLVCIFRGKRFQDLSCDGSVYAAEEALRSVHAN